MIDETKMQLEEGANSTAQEEPSMFNFQNLFAILVLNWQWFLLSLFICLCGALIYLRYATPTYQVSAKMLIKDEDKRKSSANQMLENMQNFGFMSNSAGIENEVEILKSRILARDAVINLKLYVQYYSFGRLSKHVVYGTQPVCVDLDSAALDQWDKELLEGAKSIKMVIARAGDHYDVKGETLFNNKSTGEFSQKLNQLPASVKTEYGVLTLTQNGRGF